MYLNLKGQENLNIEKAYNALFIGYHRKKDDPPERFMNKPIKSGPYKGEHIDKYF